MTEVADTSRFAREALQVPEVLAEQARAVEPSLRALLARLAREPVRQIVTLARGSSDHAASYFGYLAMQLGGPWVCSLPPSLLSLHAAPLQGGEVLALAISQSGRSPDLVASLGSLRDRGALTVALVNDTLSPLAARAEYVLPLAAGAEISVAASKSCLAQFALAARLLASWRQDGALREALEALPEALGRAQSANWPQGLTDFGGLIAAQRALVIARGLAWAAAAECALKLKEVCGIQAEALSTAEFRHGPQALIEPGYPVIVLAPPGPEQAAALALAEELGNRGAEVWLAAPTQNARAGCHDLHLAEAPDARLAPIVLLAQVYGWVEALARARGRDPDAPPHLNKVTLTH